MLIMIYINLYELVSTSTFFMEPSSLLNETFPKYIIFKDFCTSIRFYRRYLSFTVHKIEGSSSDRKDIPMIID